MDAAAGTVLFSKNGDKQFYPASITKLMTALLVAENCNLDDKVTFSATATTNLEAGAVSINMTAGDVMTVRQCLYALLLKSANEVGNALAEHVAGSNAKFAEMMNAKAAALGCTNTHFSNPHGLHDDNHYTTAEDLYKITQYAMSLPYFMDIVTQTEYTLPPTNLYTGERTIYTTNKMMDKNEPVYYEPYIEGIKTGSHDEAGYCLVTTAQKNGQRYMIVALGAPIGDVHGEMLDTKNLYDWAFQGFQESSPVLAHNVYPEIKRGQLWDKMNTVISSPWFVAICSMVIVIVVLLLSDYAQKYRHKKKNGK